MVMKKNPAMLTRIIWHDLRWRLLAAAALVGATAGVVILGLRLPAGADYLSGLDLAWFNLPGASAVLLPAAVIVGSPGTIVRPSRDVAWLMTLPVSRVRWVMSHIAASVMALAILLIACDVIFIIGARSVNATLRIGPLLARSALVLLAAGVFTPATIALTALVRRPVIAIPAAFILLSLLETSRFRLEIPAKPYGAMLPGMDPWALADPRAWNGAVPWTSIAMALGIAGIGTVAALYLFSRRDL
jgi:hypothetical protein